MSPFFAGSGVEPNDLLGRRPTSAATTAPSLTMAVYNTLRAEIIENRIKQNEKLHLANLKDRFGVSLSVVREALSRLVADTLVIAEEQRGFRVRPISKQDLLDVTQARIHIEGMAFQLSIEKGDEAWERQLVSLFHQLSHIDRRNDPLSWHQVHNAFHRMLVSACGSPWLIHFRDILFDQSERYRYFYAESVMNNRLPDDRDFVHEHRVLFESALAREAQAGLAAISTHFNNTTKAVLAGLQDECWD